MEVWGWRGKVRDTVVYGVIERPAVAAGTVLAVTTARLGGLLPAVELRDATSGARALGAIVYPVPFLGELARSRGEGRGVRGSRGRVKFEKIDDIQRAELDALGEGLVVQDASGQIAYANPAAEEILGLDATSMLGLTSKDPHLGDLDTEVRGPALVEHFDLRRAGTGEPYPFDELPLARAFFAGEATSADDIVIMRDGVEIPVEGYAAPVHDSSGEVRFALTTLRDITTRRRHEDAIDRRAGGAREHERGARRFRGDRRP